MARGKLPALDSSLPVEIYTALMPFWVYLSELEKSFDSSMQVRGDYTVLNASKGLVLKDAQATPHYWRVTISNVGAIVTTDLGTTPP